MKGSVYKSVSPSGRKSWRYQIDAGRDENGNRIRLGESGFRLEREASEAMQAKIREIGTGLVSALISLETYLAQWLPYHTKAKPLSPTTAARYKTLGVHVTAALGKVALRDLTPFMFDNLYVKLAESLSAKTIREVHNVVPCRLETRCQNEADSVQPLRWLRFAQARSEGGYRAKC